MDRQSTKSAGRPSLDERFECYLMRWEEGVRLARGLALSIRGYDPDLVVAVAGVAMCPRGSCASCATTSPWVS